MKINSIYIPCIVTSIIFLLLIGCGVTESESSSLTLSSLVSYQSNDCSGTGSEEACTDVDGNVAVSLTTQISCVAEGLSWIDYYQEWLNSINNTNSFSTIMDPNNNTCTIMYDAIELSGVWTGDSNSCQIPKFTTTIEDCDESGDEPCPEDCAEFIFTE